MPHTRSAKKRLRQSAKRRLHNRSVIKDIKTDLKSVMALAKSGPPDQLAAACKAAVKKLDKAGGRRIVHPNAVARKKSQLARLLLKTTQKA